MVVGEKGPEFWVPDTGGTVIPNHVAFSGYGAPATVSRSEPNPVKIDHFILYNDQQLYEKLKSSTAHNIIVTHLANPATKLRLGIK